MYMVSAAFNPMHPIGETTESMYWSITPNIKSHKLMGILWAHTGAIGCIGLSSLIIVSLTDDCSPELLIWPIPVGIILGIILVGIIAIVVWRCISYCGVRLPWLVQDIVLLHCHLLLRLAPHCSAVAFTSWGKVNGLHLMLTSPPPHPKMM